MKPAVQRIDESVIIDSSRKQVIDVYGELDRLVQSHKPIAARHEKLRKEILSWYPDLPADEQAVISGEIYTVTVAPRGEERHVTSMRAVMKAFGGINVFLEFCSITIRAMEEKL